ncbi:MAG: hemerythrin family protein [Phycisphaerae bacterium]|nr:hemerythrin family protein [Phycisphaerae bacterium]
MAFMTWDAAFNVNVPDIDRQHQKLIELVNRLHDAMKNGQGQDAVGRIINELIDYTTYHFSTEETYMAKVEFPSRMRHKIVHQQFVDKVLEFKKSFEQNSVCLSMKVMDFLKDWVRTHIQTMDKQYAPATVRA